MAENVISQHLQNCFVLLAITDKQFLAMARGCVKPAYFSSTITEDVIELCYNYYDQFNDCPGDHFHDELVKFLQGRDTKERKLYVEYLSAVSKLELPSKTYVISRVNQFIKAREFSASAIEFVKLTERGKFEEAEQLMMHALKTGIELQDVGIKYFENAVPTYYDSDSGEALMNIGIEALGDRVTLKRQQLVCILGGHKGKKSWFCVHLASRGIAAGLKVLYVSHEMTASEVETRFDMLFGGVVSKDIYKNVTFTETNHKGEITKRRTKEVGTVYNLRKVLAGRRAAKRFGGNLIIKKYPMGACSLGELNRYLDYLEIFEHFVPDIFINDYPDIMKLPLSDSTANRDRLNRCYIDLKRIADERNILIIVPSQTTREALEKAHLSRKDFAEDIRKLANVDLVIALAQSKNLAEENRMRITVMAARSDEDRSECLISQNIRIGQVVVDSWLEPRNDEA